MSKATAKEKVGLVPNFTRLKEQDRLFTSGKKEIQGWGQGAEGHMVLLGL